ncbi:MAG: class I SAM-dependent methyltransferase [Bacteroidia bacterium]|nr:class I SAM-dependent methyltransferase [Bacteroidia bacterium]
MLDFGCGSKPYKHFFSVAEYIGVDMVNPAYTKQSENIDYFIKDGKIPFPDNYFDSVLCTEVLEHVFSIDEVLTEISRVLKPNGRFLITLPFVWEEHEMPYDFARYSSVALITILRKHGFEVIEHRKIGNSFETIYQLKVMEVYYWLVRCISNIFIRKKIGLILIPLYNLRAIIMGKLFSKNNPNLYLNNVILSSKIGNLSKEVSKR